MKQINDNIVIRGIPTYLGTFSRGGTTLGIRLYIVSSVCTDIMNPCMLVTKSVVMETTADLSGDPFQTADLTLKGASYESK